MCVQFARSKALGANTEQELQMGALCVILPGNFGGYHTYLIFIMRIVNLVAHIEEGTQAMGVGEQGAEEDIWTLEGRRNRGVEKTT